MSLNVGEVWSLADVYIFKTGMKFEILEFSYPVCW